MSATAGVGAASDGVDAFLVSHRPAAGRSASLPESGSQAINLFFDYWLSLPRRQGMPDAADFDPTAIPRWLPDITIVEVNSPHVITYRLAGTAVVERMGHNPTGTNLLELTPPERRMQASRDLHEVVYRPCGLHLSFVNNYSSGRVGQMDSIYLPLRPPPGGSPRMVSLNAFDSTLAFRETSPRTTIIADVNGLTWIDVGFGVPEASQPRP